MSARSFGQRSAAGQCPKIPGDLKKAAVASFRYRGHSSTKVGPPRRHKGQPGKGAKKGEEGFRRRGGGYGEEGRISMCNEKIFKSIERVEGKRKSMLEGGGLCLRHKYRCKFRESYQYRLQYA